MKTHANSVRLKSLKALKAREALETVWWIWMHLSKGLEKVHAETFAWEVPYGWKRVANHARSSDQTTWCQCPLRKKEMWGAAERHRMSELTVSKTELPRPNPTNTAVKSDSVHACVKNATVAHPRCLKFFETWAAWRRFVLNHYVRWRSLRVSCPIFFIVQMKCGKSDAGPFPIPWSNLLFLKNCYLASPKCVQTNVRILEALSWRCSKKEARFYGKLCLTCTTKWGLVSSQQLETDC